MKQIDCIIIENAPGLGKQIWEDLNKFLKPQFSLNLVAEFGDIEEALKAIKSKKAKPPDIVLCDIYRRKTGGENPDDIFKTICVDRIKKLQDLREKTSPKSLFVIVSMYVDFFSSLKRSDANKMEQEITSLIASKVKPDLIVSKSEMNKGYEKIHELLIKRLSPIN